MIAIDADFDVACLFTLWNCAVYVFEKRNQKRFYDERCYENTAFDHRHRVIEWAFFHVFKFLNTQSAKFFQWWIWECRVAQKIWFSISLNFKAARRCHNVVKHDQLNLFFTVSDSFHEQFFADSQRLSSHFQTTHRHSNSVSAEKSFTYFISTAHSKR